MSWAARAKRRDEWNRAASLLSVVFNRTIFDDRTKPIAPLEWIPRDLIDADEKTLTAIKPAVVTISVSDFAKGLKHGR